MLRVFTTTNELLLFNAVTGEQLVVDARSASGYEWATHSSPVTAQNASMYKTRYNNPTSVSAVAISDDGDWMAVADTSSQVVTAPVPYTQDASVRHCGHALGGLAGVSFVCGGAFVVSAGRGDGALLLWEANAAKTASSPSIQ
jgi:hypothetical protein